MECNICLENKTEHDIVFLNCMHYLCNNCNKKLIVRICPFCRYPIESDNLSDNENENDTVTELETVLQHIDNRHKKINRRKNQAISDKLKQFYRIRKNQWKCLV